METPDGPHDGEMGDEVGLGSVLRRRVGGGLLAKSTSSEVRVEYGLLTRREGTGEDLNSSMRSVSGTGSMAADRHGRHKASGRAECSSSQPRGSKLTVGVARWWPSHAAGRTDRQRGVPWRCSSPHWQQPGCDVTLHWRRWPVGRGDERGCPG